MLNVLRIVVKNLIKLIPLKELRRKARKRFECWYEEKIVVSIIKGKLKEKIEKIEKEFPTVLSYEETLKKIIFEKKSVSRFGDGELGILLDRGIGFQKNNNILKKRLEEIIQSEDEKILVCLFNLKNDRLNKENLKEKSISNYFQEYFWSKNYSKLKKYFIKGKKYGNANMTRVGVFHKLKLEEIKKIWKDKEVVFVYSKEGRFIIDERLFGNLRSYEEIFIPPINAFDEYEEILEECKTKEKEKLFLISAGPTATVLAYDLSLLGYQAIDIGHFPNCYQQYLGEIVSPELLPRVKKKSKG